MRRPALSGLVVAALAAAAVTATPGAPAHAATAAVQPGDIIVTTEWHDFFGTLITGVDRIDPVTGARSNITWGGYLGFDPHVASAANGDLYVTSESVEGNTVYLDLVKIDHLTGQQSRFYHGSGADANDIAVAADGSLWVGSWWPGDELERVTHISASGTWLSETLLSGKSSADHSPNLVPQRDGSLVVSHDSKIDRITDSPASASTITTLAGPIQSLAALPDGDLVAHLAPTVTAPGRLVRVDRPGITLTTMTGTPVVQPQAGTGLAVDAAGKLLLATSTDVLRVDPATGTTSPIPAMHGEGPVDVTVAGVPQMPPAPLGTPDSYKTTNRGAKTEPAAYGVLANDHDVAGARLRDAVVVTAPGHGKLAAFGADGSFSYVPDAGYVGSDWFTYTAVDASGVRSAPVPVSITVVQSPAPVAAPDAYTATAGKTLTVADPGVLANDTDPKGVALRAFLQQQPAHGTLQLSDHGGFVYSPAAGFTGQDSFTYRATNGVYTSAETTVSLTVHAAAAPPKVTVAAGGSVSADALTATLKLVLSDADTATSALTLKASSSNTSLVPNSGVVFSGSGANRTVAVKRTSGKSGTAVVTVTVSDGSHSASTLVTLKVGADSGSGADTLTGTSGTDILAGRNGADKLDGAGGNDILIGGQGDDTLKGGTGADLYALVGGGKDVLTGFNPAEGDTKS
ncbi:hypothetical protein CLV35_2056 [Motilibacter peucedani]|uniref:Tandem-95 repeat protein n=1 Tax=Motilibacter peucedani TaxID=598650 RepID=A0A420XQV2_9ACTN|nr:Ig-like domain-containing protein [Motilibacter peucedani]RKS75582.1 hypothetical protein CLV35_2056 [Motilibacter peucedani]